LVENEAHARQKSYSRAFYSSVTRRPAAFWTTCSFCCSRLLKQVRC